MSCDLGGSLTERELSYPFPPNTNLVWICRQRDAFFNLQAYFIPCSPTLGTLSRSCIGFWSSPKTQFCCQKMCLSPQKHFFLLPRNQSWESSMKKSSQGVIQPIQLSFILHLFWNLRKWEIKILHLRSQIKLSNLF